MVSTTTRAPRPPRTSRPRGVWRLVVGLVSLIAALILWSVSAGVLLAGHPAQPITIGLLGLLGLVLIRLGVRDLRSPRELRRGGSTRSWLVVIGRVVAGLLVAVVVGALVYLVPLSGTPEAIAALAGTSEVRVTSDLTTLTLTPTRAGTTTGLVFQPGARVDPRAYLPLLERVSAAGYLVVIVKQPYDIGFTAIGAPGGIIAAHPQITHWAVGGHSLGGVAASSYADGHPQQVTGLLLWASYPLGSLAARTDLAVTSVSGTKDGLATPADIEASRTKLPTATTFVAVVGGVHAYFGDYGPQPGDGTPTVDRPTAQDQIVTASTALLARLSSP